MSQLNFLKREQPSLQKDFRRLTLFQKSIGQDSKQLSKEMPFGMWKEVGGNSGVQVML